MTADTLHGIAIGCIEGLVVGVALIVVGFVVRCAWEAACMGWRVFDKLVRWFVQ